MISDTGVRPSSNEAAEQSSFKAARTERIEIKVWPRHLLSIQGQSTRSCQPESDDVEEVDCRRRPQPPPDSEQRRALSSPHCYLLWSS
jgi:hypothetical protein